MDVWLGSRQDRQKTLSKHAKTKQKRSHSILKKQTMMNKTAKKGNDSGKLNQNGTFEKKGALLKKYTSAHNWIQMYLKSLG